jgi:hypothetical protein
MLEEEEEGEKTGYNICMIRHGIYGASSALEWVIS